MTSARHQGLRAEKLGCHVDKQTEALTERVAPLERRTVSTANLHSAAWRLRMQQVLQAEIRGLGTLRMRKAAESPLRFAFGRIPLLPQLSCHRWGSRTRSRRILLSS